MSIIATIMNTATGLPIQKMKFGRMPKPWISFNLESGELVTAERIDVGKTSVQVRVGGASAAFKDLRVREATLSDTAGGAKIFA